MTDQTNTIRWDNDADGIVTLTLDDPAQRANTMTRAYQESMKAAVDRLYAETRRDHRRDRHLRQGHLLRRR